MQHPLPFRQIAVSAHPQTISTTHRDSGNFAGAKGGSSSSSHTSSLNLPPLSLQACLPSHPTPRLSSGDRCNINIWDSRATNNSARRGQPRSLGLMCCTFPGSISDIIIYVDSALEAVQDTTFTTIFSLMNNINWELSGLKGLDVWNEGLLAHNVFSPPHYPASQGYQCSRVK